MWMPVLSMNASLLRLAINPLPSSSIACVTRSPSSAAFDRSISPEKWATGSPAIDSSSKSASGITVLTPELWRIRGGGVALRNPQDQQNDVVPRLGVGAAAE